MKSKILFRLWLLLLITAFWGMIAYGESVQVKNSLGSTRIKIDFKKEIEENNLQMTIYFLSLNALTRHPLNNKDLIKSHQYQIVVKNNKLRGYLKKLNKINEITFKKTTMRYENVRVYCKFTSQQGLIFSFSLACRDSRMLINGVMVENNRYMYELIKSFLPLKERLFYDNSLRYIPFEG